MPTKIRESAKGAPCLLRVPGVCSHDRDSVVHCHIRRVSSGGIGLKPNDLNGVRACFPCHEWLDRRDGFGPHQEYRDTLIHDGHIRTLDALVLEGIIVL